MKKRPVHSILLATLAAACGPSDDGALHVQSDQALLGVVGGVLDALLPDDPSCKRWRSVSAALGSRTIDCLGTIEPGQYAVQSGRLVASFAECTPGVSAEVHADVLALLGIQHRDSDAARCLAGRYESWVRNFARTGISKCPRWEKVATINAPSAESIDDLVRSLPVLPVAGEILIPAPHEYYRVSLRFPGGGELRCIDAASCARQCSDAFPGLWISGLVQTAIIDPTYWLSSLKFSSTSSNPFMRDGFHHGMSYENPPDIYGHANRAGEPCSRSVNGVHMLYTLKLDCLVPDDRATCVTVCRP